MIKINLPNQYELLNNESLFVTNPDSKYAHDSIYQISKNMNEYENYLDSLVKDVGSSAHKRFYENIKQFLLHYTYLHEEALDSPRYKYTQNRIIICVPQSKLDQLAVILGAPFFYVTAVLSRQSRLMYLPRTAKVITFLLSKIQQRPSSETDEYVTQLVIAWLLRKHDMLRPTILSKYCIKADVGFVSPKELKRVYDLVHNFKDIIEFFDTIGEQYNLNGSVVRQSFVTRYGIDVTLGFEDVAHFVYNTTLAEFLNYPSVVSQVIKFSPVKIDAGKIATSVASRLNNLPGLI